MGRKRKEMSEQLENLSQGPDPQTVLCKVIDVEAALGRSFQRFIEEKKGSLEDLVGIAREELSKMELFIPNP